MGFTKTEYTAVLEDPQRIEVIEDLGLVDTSFEVAFDRLTKLASKIINAPISLVSIVDADRQFFKSHFGLGEPWASKRETPLSHSFCQHVVVSGEPLIVEDAREHPLVKHNLAIRDLNVIGYLGMPLSLSSGEELGSFCVIDDKPRQWTEREIEIVRDLAQAVMTEIELRNELKRREAMEASLDQQNKQLRRLNMFCQNTLEQMSDAVRRGSPREELLDYLQTVQNEFSRL